jgi:hypothetical protein
MGLVFGECGREITPGKWQHWVRSGEGGAARMEQLRAQLHLQLERGNAGVEQTKWRSIVEGVVIFS